MADNDIPQVIPLDVATVALDSTGSPQYDGEARLSWPFGTPAPYTSGRFTFGLNLDQTDIDIDVILRDYGASSDVASADSLTSDSDQVVRQFDPTDISPSSNVGLQVDVDSKSGTSGAEAHIAAKLILLP